MTLDHFLTHSIFFPLSGKIHDPAILFSHIWQLKFTCTTFRVVPKKMKLLLSLLWSKPFRVFLSYREWKSDPLKVTCRIPFDLPPTVLLWPRKSSFSSHFLSPFILAVTSATWLCKLACGSLPHLHQTFLNCCCPTGTSFDSAVQLISEPLNVQHVSVPFCVLSSELSPLVWSTVSVPFSLPNQNVSAFAQVLHRDSHQRRRPALL